MVGLASWGACASTLNQIIRDGAAREAKELEDFGEILVQDSRKKYCYEVSWTPRRVLVPSNIKFPHVVDMIAGEDQEAMRPSITVYGGGRRLAVFGSGRMGSVQRLGEERTCGNSKKKGFWKRFSSRIWGKIKLH